jgi:hypothetical protein
VGDQLRRGWWPESGTTTGGGLTRRWWARNSSTRGTTWSRSMRSVSGSTASSSASSVAYWPPRRVAALTLLTVFQHRGSHVKSLPQCHLLPYLEPPGLLHSRSHTTHSIWRDVESETSCDNVDSWLTNLLCLMYTCLVCNVYAS